MAKKPAAQSPATKTPAPVAAAKPLPPATHKPSGSISSNAPPPVKPVPQSALSPRSSPQEIIVHVWNRYLQDTPSRTMLLDAFMAWLVVVGAVQFLYCILAGNYTSERPPTSASAAAKKSTAKTIDGISGEVIEQGKISSERAFADFVFGSLILHGFCVNFIN
ncbi:Dolichyl-diphosphooligosaccharide--protein glycosyltransferase subunit dad-1 [Cladophialophora carrionii]|uniref:Dolichyl-diphosphooligosaccharide--protein glycosyltransferase subunit OST2 n=1 Tax=Cladophialophora carrionii TaxID=86049 RepID=A0A1C1C7Q9_9EURO|nr:Dolichyl-diphosphooligosaccharide--protein glycosyltransferase subunit dad-1 [Cladophialophora carrionii]